MILVATLYVCILVVFVDVTHTLRVTATMAATAAEAAAAAAKRLVNAVRPSTQSLLPSKMKCENVQIRFCG